MHKNKLLAVLGVIFLSALIAGCHGTSEKAGERITQNKQTVKSIMEEASNGTQDTSVSEEPITNEQTTIDASDVVTEDTNAEAVDTMDTSLSMEEDFIDLTKLNSIMVYTEVYNMMYYPENFEGKTVKAKGMFNYCEATEEEKALYGNDYYYYTVIQDATACCQQGLEFVLKEDPGFPENYPKVGQDVTVCGRFEIYYEGETMYAHLVDATFEF